MTFSRILPFAAFCAIYVGVYFVPNFLPLIAEGLIGGAGFSAAQAGQTLTAYMGPMSFAAFLIAAGANRLRGGWMAALALLMLTGGYGVIALAGGNVAVIMIGMAVAGSGNGILFAVANAAIAHRGGIDALYGAGAVASCLFAAAIAGPFNDALVKGGLGDAIMIALAMLPFMAIAGAVLGRQAMLRIGKDAAEGDKTDATLSAPGKSMMAGGMTAAALIVSIFLSNVSQMTFYPFGGTLLSRAGFDAQTIGMIFAALFFVAALGSLLASVISVWSRFLMPMLVASTAGLAAVILAATWLTDPIAVAAAVCAEAAMAMLIMAVQFAAASALDKSGRLAAAASGTLFLSWTTGPSLGGWLVDSFGFSGLALASLVLGGLATLCALHVWRHAAGAGHAAALARPNGAHRADTEGPVLGLAAK